MNRNELNALLSAIITMRTASDDETALSAMAIYPLWRADTSYTESDRVRYGEMLYRCVQSHTSQSDWTPDVAVSLWVRVDDPSIEYPEWRQPTGAQDAYAKGAKVSHNGKRWISDYDSNVWEPGVYGWTEV